MVEQTSWTIARQRQLRAAHPAADGLGALVDDDRPTRLGEGDGGGEPIGAGADDDSIGGVAGHATRLGGGRGVERRCVSGCPNQTPWMGHPIEAGADGRVVPDVARVVPLAPSVDAGLLHRRLRVDPEACREVVERRQPEGILLLVAEEAHRDLVERVVGPQQHLDARHGVAVLRRARERDPGREHVALGRHEGERLLVSVDAP